MSVQRWSGRLARWRERMRSWNYGCRDSSDYIACPSFTVR
jgi:hypothetical protein